MVLFVCADARAADTRAAVAPRLVDINTASISELMALDGIDELRAKMIDAYRYTYGPFRSIEDLARVPDIGISDFERVKRFICVDTGAMRSVSKHSVSDHSKNMVDTRSKIITRKEMMEDIRTYSQKIRKNPRDTDAYIRRAWNYEGLNRIPRALEDYSKAIEIDSTAALAYSFRGVVRNFDFALRN